MSRRRLWRSQKHRVRRHARSTTGTAARSAPAPGPTPVHQESAPAWGCDPEVARSGAVVPVLKTLARNPRPIARHFIRAQLIRAQRCHGVNNCRVALGLDPFDFAQGRLARAPVPTQAKTKGRLASPLLESFCLTPRRV